MTKLMHYYRLSWQFEVIRFTLKLFVFADLYYRNLLQFRHACFRELSSIRHLILKSMQIHKINQNKLTNVLLEILCAYQNTIHTQTDYAILYKKA